MKHKVLGRSECTPDNIPHQLWDVSQASRLTHFQSAPIAFLMDLNVSAHSLGSAQETFELNRKLLRPQKLLTPEAPAYSFLIGLSAPGTLGHPEGTEQMSQEAKLACRLLAVMVSSPTVSSGRRRVGQYLPQRPGGFTKVGPRSRRCRRPSLSPSVLPVA